MHENNNVKESLKNLYELTTVTNFRIDGKEATIKDVQELFQEEIINLMDLLGHESIYLDEK
ncbi:hypothetical protein HED34_02935 [Vagococcus fluvialis]|uniref:hypothetical protein n=1 Tax=Vagococcus fluvialis TaxID=2738 RepID=UPI0014329252|nr:hypothetical protein [Vagococcus fluvialis]NKC58916.1 hypothetical protein [Vagococcus fluvialis]NKD49671.1 hypothetical protein [Vagococcus fluvialis]